MPDRTMMIDGVRVPRFFYGTAWKEDETARLTALALGQGMRWKAVWWRGTIYSYRPSSPSAVGRIIACPMTPRLPYRTRSRNRSRARSSI